VEAFLAHKHPGEEIFWVLVSLPELVHCLDFALHRNEAEEAIVKTLIHRPKSKILLEVSEVHPEDTVIALAIEANHLTESVSPEAGSIAPISVPFATTPWVSQFDESDCSTIDKHLSS
jgi:hypothetical protein